MVGDMAWQGRHEWCLWGLGKEWGVWHMYAVENSNIQQSSIELQKGIETRETNSNIAKYERNRVINMTRCFQSLTHQICQINDKCHVTI